jgi:hypothetical protein
MPIRSIEVTSSQTQLAGRNYPFKMVSWPYPYTRLATQIRGELSPAQGFLHCRQWSESEEKLYAETRALIMNGIRSKELFDCKRGLSGVFIHEDDDPSKAITGVVRPQSYNGQYYRSICLRVMQETPYSPE